MLHPTLHVHAQYEIENLHLATVMDGMFITLPTALDVKAMFNDKWTLMHV